MQHSERGLGSGREFDAAGKGALLLHGRRRGGRRRNQAESTDRPLRASFRKPGPQLRPCLIRERRFDARRSERGDRSAQPGAEKKPATSDYYPNLFFAAGITRDQQLYSRCLDAVLAEEGIGADEIVGVGVEGVASKSNYVVHRKASVLATERGVFNKRIDVERRYPIASIARLQETTEGFKPRKLTITGWNAQGNDILKVAWTEGFEDWEKRLVTRQSDHLFGVIAQVMKKY